MINKINEKSTYIQRILNLRISENNSLKIDVEKNHKNLENSLKIS